MITLTQPRTANSRGYRCSCVPGSDWVAKIDVTGLEPRTNYVFAFVDAEGVVSDVGQTKTAPGADQDVDELHYALFSCAKFSLDFWVHVGDYVYEHPGWEPYSRDVLECVDLLQPQWEQVGLPDYRCRQATYHAYDEGLRNLRTHAPLIAIWDDHETANNAYGTDNEGKVSAATASCFFVFRMRWSWYGPDSEAHLLRPFA
jgi:alkaline phosphatase D